MGVRFWAPFSVSAKETVLVDPKVEGAVMEIVCLLGVAAISLLGSVVAWRCFVWISFRRSVHLGFHA